MTRRSRGQSLPGVPAAALRPRDAVLVAAVLLLVGLGPLADAAAQPGRTRGEAWLRAAPGSAASELRSEPARPVVEGRRDTTRTVARPAGACAWVVLPSPRVSASPSPWALWTERHSDEAGCAAPVRDPELSRPPPDSL